MSDQIVSLIRTAVPYVIGYLVSLLASWGLDIPAEIKGQLEALLTLAIGTLYYYIVRKLEAKWPKLGHLLIVAKTPEYK
jgi:hypothetical protein